MAIRALVVDPTAAVTMRMADVPEPTPGPDQVVVEARHVSLNYGDLMDAVSGRIPPGGVLGSDVAGVVVQAAADGSGPAVGARVVALAEGAYAERVAIAVSSLAELPADVELSVAAALPVAGLAALRTLRASGPLEGRRVLVTGASGGVGSFAIQLAAAGGAHVIASVGASARGEGLQALGADEVVVGLDGVESADVILDSVGGPQLVAAWGLLAPGGSAHSIGWTSGEPAVLPPYATVGPVKTLSSYLTLAPFADDLRELVGLVAAGAVGVEIGWRGSWEQIAEATAALRERRVRGKAILDLS